MLVFDKNAFAAPVSKHDHTQLVKNIAESVVRRKMSVPVILLIESLKPINRLASQVLIVFSPLLALFVTYDKIDDFCDMLQDRKWIEQLIAEIEKNREIVH